MRDVQQKLHESPPAPAQPEVKPKGRKPAGTKQAGRKRKQLSTPPKSSFRRNLKGARLSPFAKATAARKCKGKPAASRPSPAASRPSPASGASSSLQPGVNQEHGDMHNVNPVAHGENTGASGFLVLPSHSLQDIHAGLLAQGVPKELLPDAKPPGMKSYTKKSSAHKGSLQVLHYKRGFYLNAKSNGEVPHAQSIQWNTHGTCEDAWKWTKKLLEW